MKPSLAGLTVLVTLGFLLNLGFSLHQRGSLFKTSGTAQSLTVVEQESGAWASLLPPRKHYVYRGRLGPADTLIETSRPLQAGTVYPVLYLRGGTAVNLPDLAGRTDRLIPLQGNSAAVWFAYGRPDAPTWINTLTDLPLTECIFWTGWLLIGIGATFSSLPSKQRRLRHNPLKSVHPVLQSSTTAEPTPGPASERIALPSRPPPLPEPKSDSVDKQVESLTLPRRNKPASDTGG